MTSWCPGLSRHILELPSTCPVIEPTIFHHFNLNQNAVMITSWRYGVAGQSAASMLGLLYWI